MIVITGSNGFIATHLSSRLDNVVGITKEQSPIIESLLDKYKPEYIYHTGAELYDQDKMFDSNVLLTYHILEYCRRATNLKRLIILGSSSEYGRKIHPIKETDQLDPYTIYEGTKSAASLLAQSYSYTYKIPIFIIRPFTVYGPGEKPNKFLHVLFRKKQNKDKHISVSEGVHDYVYIDDFINAMLNIVATNQECFDIINIGSGIQTSNLDVVHLFEKVTNYKFESYSKLEKKVYDSDNWVCDPDKVNKYYKIQTSLEDGLKKMYSFTVSQKTLL